MTEAAAIAAPAPILPELGSKAPAFTLPTDGGREVSLASLKGKKVVLYFYPKDDTPGCATEAKDFRDLQAEFAAANTIIIGLSKDDVKSHDKFKAKHALNFDLASDNAETCEAYGVWGEKNMYGRTYMGVLRTTFLIDENGIIAQVWPRVSVTEHAKEVLNAAKTRC